MSAEASGVPFPPVGPRQSMPSLARISAYWESIGVDLLKGEFPDNRAPAIGWGEPFCFRCGWLAPVPCAATYPREWPAKRILDATWNSASGWLERAHLQDHSYGGTEAVDNLVPLCVLCHSEQAICRSREEGRAFVNTQSESARIVGFIQLVTDTSHRDVVRPGRGQAMRAMLRAHVVVARAMAAELHATKESL